MVLMRGLGSKAHTARVKHSVLCDPSRSPPTPLDCLLRSAAQLLQGSAWECVRRSGRLESPVVLWPYKCLRESLPGRAPVPGGGRYIPPISPGSTWQARNRPWYRQLQGRRYNSFALETSPRNSRQGGRKRAGPSPLTGVCKTMVPCPV